MQGRILAVDDVPEILDLIKEYLTMHDYQVLTARDGVEALEVLEKETVDIVLTDIRMPRMDGFELTKKIKAHYTKIGIIVMTAFTSIYSEGDIREIGVDDYIAKPFSPEKMKEKIDALCIQIGLLKEKDNG